MPSSFASGLTLIAGACSSAPITATGTIGAPRLEREPHEALAELGELVALRERLADAARALGEHEHGLLGGEQAAAVLRRAGDLAPAREQVRRERHGRHEELDHRAHEARLRRLEEARAADHEAVERQLAGVVGDEDHAAARRDVLDAVTRSARK